MNQFIIVGLAVLCSPFISANIRHTSRAPLSLDKSQFLDASAWTDAKGEKIIQLIGDAGDHILRYYLRSPAGRNRQSGKRVYRFEAGTFVLQGDKLVCISDPEISFTSTSPRAENISPDKTGVYLSFRDKVYLDSEQSVHREIDLHWNRPMPTITMGKITFKYWGKWFYDVFPW